MSNTPSPCDKCQHLYYNPMAKDDAIYEAECSLSLKPDKDYCEFFEDWELTCSFCHKPIDPTTAHRHNGSYVGDECCWDERLRTTE